MSHRLSDVIEEHIAALEAQGNAKNTIKTHRYALNKLLSYCGNIQIKHITDRHVDELFAALQAKGLKPNTLNITRDALRSLFRYAQRRRYVPDGRTPVGHVKKFRGMPRKKLRVPARDFPRLLDEATHPRDRIIVALGLYLFLRASEVCALRVGDVDLDSGSVDVTVEKTKQRDVMPICGELDEELRRWLTYYTQDQQETPDSEWYLVPAHGAPRPTWDPSTKRWGMRYGERNLDPTRRMTTAARRIGATLRAAGYPTREADGKAGYQGVHTLRRSGARALYDQRVSEGHDSAIREVQAMLHHKSIETTELYIGIDLDVHRRNSSIRGRRMFPTTGENVVPLKAAER